MHSDKNISGLLDDLLRQFKLHWRLEKTIRQLGRLRGAFYRNSRPDVSQGRALIFCTSYINDVQRYQRWIDYVYPRRDVFGADCVILINDGMENVEFDDRLALVDVQKELPRKLPGDLVMFTFPDRLGRPSMFCYPGWWRSFTYSVRIAQKYGFDKIIHIESDAFVCSRRLADHIRSINWGWTSLWSHCYSMPETAIQVICRDSFENLERFANGGDEFFQSSNTAAEYLLPFRKIESQFKGDRYAMLGRHLGGEVFDFLTQVRPEWDFNSDF